MSRASWGRMKPWGTTETRGRPVDGITAAVTFVTNGHLEIGECAWLRLPFTSGRVPLALVAGGAGEPVGANRHGSLGRIAAPVRRSAVQREPVS